MPAAGARKSLERGRGSASMMGGFREMGRSAPALAGAPHYAAVSQNDPRTTQNASPELGAGGLSETTSATSGRTVGSGQRGRPRLREPERGDELGWSEAAIGFVGPHIVRRPCLFSRPGKVVRPAPGSQLDQARDLRAIGHHYGHTLHCRRGEIRDVSERSERRGALADPNRHQAKHEKPGKPSQAQPSQRTCRAIHLPSIALNDCKLNELVRAQGPDKSDERASARQPARRPSNPCCVVQRSSAVAHDRPRPFFVGVPNSPWVVRDEAFMRPLLGDLADR